MKIFPLALLVFSGIAQASEGCNTRSINGAWFFSFNGKPTYQCKITFNDAGVLLNKLCTQLPFGEIKSTNVSGFDRVEIFEGLDGCEIRGELQLYKKTTASSDSGAVDDLKLLKPFIIKFNGLIGNTYNTALGSYYRDYKEKVRPDGSRDVIFSDGASFSAIKTHN